MHATPPLVWTDVPLMPDGRALLADKVTLVVATEGVRNDLARADAVIAGGRLIGDAAFFASAPRLQVLARAGIGYERIDVDAATRAGVCIVNTPDAPTESTAEFAVAMLLALARRVVPAAAGLPAGRWSQGPELLGQDLEGKTLGLIGCGRIGRRVAEVATALRMRVLAFDPAPVPLPPTIQRADSLAALLAAADFVSVHVPLVPATRHLIGAAQFAQMKRGAFLVNSARGPIVDEAALLAALNSDHLAGAAIDVWEPEPPPLDNPLLRHPRVLATPHIAAFTREGRTRSHVAAAKHVLAALRGEKPETLVNPEVWPRRRQFSPAT